MSVSGTHGSGQLLLSSLLPIDPQKNHHRPIADPTTNSQEAQMNHQQTMHPQYTSLKNHFFLFLCSSIQKYQNQKLVLKKIQQPFHPYDTVVHVSIRVGKYIEYMTWCQPYVIHVKRLLRVHTQCPKREYCWEFVVWLQLSILHPKNTKLGKSGNFRSL